jgi:hypothetical protein
LLPLVVLVPVGFDRTDHEPEEWDPEAEYTDPDSDSLTIPRVSTEDAGSTLRTEFQEEFGSTAESEEDSTAETDVSSDLLQAFWTIVLVANGAILALSLGGIFLLFEGASTHAFALVVGGVVLSGFAVRRYRTYQRTAPSESAGDDEDSEHDEDSEPAESDASEPPAGDPSSTSTTDSRSPGDTDRS